MVFHKVMNLWQNTHTHRKNGSEFKCARMRNGSYSDSPPDFEPIVVGPGHVLAHKCVRALCPYLVNLTLLSFISLPALHSADGCAEAAAAVSWVCAQ